MMMRESTYNQALLMQYRSLPKLLSVAAESEEAMEVLAAILSRDELEEQEGRTLQRSLSGPDRAFARALAGLGEEWWDCILKWSAECEFASSGWWVSVLTAARQMTGRATSLSDVFSPVVDIWIAVVDDAGSWGSDLVLRMDQLLLGVTSGVKAVGHGIAGEDWNTSLIPAVSYRKSVHVGFALSRRELDGRNHVDPKDIEATRRCVDALALLGSEGRQANIDDPIPWEETQIQLRTAYDKIRKSLAPDAKMLLNAKASITTTQACIRNIRPYRRQEPMREVSLEGTVRAVDLDACRLKLRSCQGQLTTLRYDQGALFPGDLKPGEWLDKLVTIRAYTFKREPIPSTAKLLEIDLCQEITEGDIT